MLIAGQMSQRGGDIFLTKSEGEDLILTDGKDAET